MTLRADPAYATAQYRGYFLEPIFGVLGNPAPLYSSLVRHLSPFGASVSGLSINLAILDEANVSCVITSGVVRVSINHVEVFLRAVTSVKQMRDHVAAVWALLLDVDETLKPATHEVNLSTWNKVQNGSFDTFISRFVTAPPNALNWRPAVEFTELGDDGREIGSVHLAESKDAQSDLFLRSAIKLGLAAPEMALLTRVYSERLRSQLATLDLELTLAED